MRAVLVQATKAWGVLPSAVGLCSEDDDIAYMVAWEQAENRMIAWERQEQEKEAKRNAKNRA